VNSVQAKKELQHIDKTDHIINRNIAKVALGTDSLFMFNSTELLHSSYPALDKLIRDINICPNQIDRIKIIGHTDRIGNKKVNEKLSVKRAQVVADYLTKHGVSIPMDVEGHGSREPVTTKCRGKISPQLIQCLQPDRRVVIEY
jgi:outer membrane protein OmpA-like peptidoglycan-associated protein